MANYYHTYTCTNCKGSISFLPNDRPEDDGKPFVCEHCRRGKPVKMVFESTPSGEDPRIKSQYADAAKFAAEAADLIGTAPVCNYARQAEGRTLRDLPILHEYQIKRLADMVEHFKEGCPIKLTVDPHSGKTRYYLEVLKMSDSGRTIDDDRACTPDPNRRTSILHEWVEKLGLRHQGVLMTAIRGCDIAPKDDPSKRLARCIRNAILRAHCGDSRKSASFIEHCDPAELRKRIDDFASNLDHYPWHYIAHVMHASEILAYRHPGIERQEWEHLYFTLCRKFHVKPESKEELHSRLNKNEDDFAADQDGEQATKYKEDRHKGQQEIFRKAYARGSDDCSEVADLSPKFQPATIGVDPSCDVKDKTFATVFTMQTCERSKMLDEIFCHWFVNRLTGPDFTKDIPAYHALAPSSQANVLMTIADELDLLAKGFSQPVGESYRRASNHYRMRAAKLVKPLTEEFEESTTEGVSPKIGADVEAEYIFGEGGGVGAGRRPMHPPVIELLNTTDGVGGQGGGSGRRPSGDDPYHDHYSAAGTREGDAEARRTQPDACASGEMLQSLVAGDPPAAAPPTL